MRIQQKDDEMNKHESKFWSHVVTAVAIIAVIGVLAYGLTTGGWLKYLSVATPQPTGGGGSSTIPVTSLNCTVPNGGQVLSYSQSYQSFSTNPPTVTLVAGSYSVYSNQFQSGQVAQFTGTSSSANAIPVGSGQLNCGTTYAAVSADNANYYEEVNYTNTGSKSTSPISATVFKYAAATQLVSNSINGGSPTANAIVGGIATGALVTNETVSIKAGTDYYGTPTLPGQNPEGFLVIYAYNSLAVTSINIPGAVRFSGVIPSITYVGNQNQEVAFLFPAIHYSQYATPTGASSGYASFAPQIQMSSGFSGTTQNTFVQEAIVPLTNYYTVGGQWVTGTAINQQTGANIFTPVSAGYFMQIQHP